MSSLLNHPWALTWLATLLAYLVGSLSFAVIVSRLMGLHDPRTYGSKNPGATNVLRSGSKKAAVLTLLMDAVKGWVPVMLVKLHGPAYGLGDGTLALVALGAFVGHLWPVFFRFQGGKGVATAAGVLIGLQPLLGLATALTWVTVAYVSRYSSLAALAASVLAPAYYLLADRVIWYADQGIALAVTAMSALLLYRHRENMARLLAGTESKIGGGKKKD